MYTNYIIFLHSILLAYITFLSIKWEDVVWIFVT